MSAYSVDREEDIEKDIKVLEKLAKDVLELKQKSRSRRPIFIEFCGTPKSGKSSCINSLNTFLKRNNFTTRILAERAGICPVKDKSDPLFNLWTTCSAITELAELFSNEAKDIDVIIADRAIFDGLIWFEWMLEKKHLDEDDYKSINKFLLMKKWKSLIDLVYVFKAKPSISMDREYANLLTKKTGSIMNEKTLSTYNKAIDKTIKLYGGNFREVETLDTSDKKQNAVSFIATETVLNILKDLITERIGYVEREKLKKFEDKVFFKFSEIIKNNNEFKLNFDYRDKVEENQELVQPIPIITVTNKKRNEVLVLKKKIGSLSKKSPEKDKHLVYSGGHIRKEDDTSEGSNFLSIAANALSREIKEELDISLSPKLVDPLCIWAKGNSKSEQHLAMLYVFEADLELIDIKLDSYEYVLKRGTSKSGRIFKIKDLIDYLKDDKEDLEDWSKIILQEVFGIKFQAKLFN